MVPSKFQPAQNSSHAVCGPQDEASKGPRTIFALSTIPPETAAQIEGSSAISSAF